LSEQDIPHHECNPAMAGTFSKGIFETQWFSMDAVHHRALAKEPYY
jgi:hypothetical protein